MDAFRLVAPFKPMGDQPAAIDALTQGLRDGEQHQVLLGVTGSGKTFSVANVIENVQRPTLVLAHNKTLAAQLFEEFREFFPDNAVEYFVSYYDYFQPEAYIPSSDTYIEKDSHVNDAIDRMRLSATRSLFERRDVIIVASVSCIYGLGSAEAYYGMLMHLERGMELDRDAMLRRLIEIQYSRNDYDFHRGTFRVRGDVVDIFPAYEEMSALRVEFFGDEVDRIVRIDPLRGTTGEELDRVAVYPGSHYVVSPERKSRAVQTIREELRERLAELRDDNKLVEAQRLEQRTTFDLEMLETMGFCNGIENYSRHVTGGKPGEPPSCLLDYFPDDWLIIVDESHVSVPQVGAMYRGDRARKSNLVDYGFRLPSALDNRPLRFEEFEERVNQAIYVSATPGNYELDKTDGVIIEQIIRPTGLLDPVIDIRPVATQVDDVVEEIRRCVDEDSERVLVTTLTKRMSEDLTEYMTEVGIRARYLHSDIDTLERIELIRELRQGTYDVLVGINLLREGLDLPEVGLVAILDADKEGFLRSERSLIQTAGRAARNIRGRVIMYADRITGSIQACIDETARRRETQAKYNAEHGITPRSVQRAIKVIDTGEEPTSDPQAQATALLEEAQERGESAAAQISRLRTAMREAAAELEFERAAALRDQIQALEAKELGLAR